jgi:hypothetical protein
MQVAPERSSERRRIERVSFDQAPAVQVREHCTRHELRDPELQRNAGRGEPEATTDIRRQDLKDRPVYISPASCNAR